jgi:hypothetical protein
VTDPLLPAGSAVLQPQTYPFKAARVYATHKPTGNGVR